MHRTGLVEESQLVTREARMVLPAIFLTFVFDLSTMSNTSFREHTSPSDVAVSIIALLGLCAGAAALLVPALYGRVTPWQMSRRSLHVGEQGVKWPLLPISLKLATDMYLEARVVLGGWLLPCVLGGAVILVCIALLLVLPRIARSSPARTS